MKDFSIIKSLIGESVTEEELKNVDCYAHTKAGLFIPSTGPCGYAARLNHTHPSYMIVILFSADGSSMIPEIEINRNDYLAAILSPDIPHTDIVDGFGRYYCILIDREYFEKQFRMYTEKKPDFQWKQFAICHDILKALNTFAFEYRKQIPNSEITLDAQVTIITHWIIRSVLEENLDMRSISSNYDVARAEQYIEQHFGEDITVRQLAGLVNLSVSSFNRIFKKETNQTPVEYITVTRIEKAKILLRRKELPITEIALRCGFKSSAYFSTCFTRVLCVTPSEYRNSYRE